MNKFIRILINLFNKIDFISKIYYTLFIIIIYRLGSFIPIPFINNNFFKLNPSYKGIIHFLTPLTGANSNRVSILSLGIMPYISASILTQLMCYMFPSLYKIQQDGEIGIKKINNITKVLTILISLIQAPVYITILISSNIKENPYNLILIHCKKIFIITSIICITTGTFFTMWLGEKINDKGIGNGNSLIIISGILSRFIYSIISEIFNRLKNNNKLLGIIILLFELFIWLLIIGISIIIINFVKKIHIQYVNKFYLKNYSSNEIYLRNEMKFLPLKVVYPGVMPIIFSQGILLIFITIFNKINNLQLSNNGIWYNILYSILIIIITFFYTFLSIPVNKISDDLKINGVYIPNRKPGKDTCFFLKKIVSQIYLTGSLLLVIIALLPSIFISLGGDKNFSLFFGGTTIIIIVGGLLDIKYTINSYLLKYKSNYY
ncbi:MAG: preprotein translocase subunit SecY [Candidatus Sulcia muelleri]|uniref:Protein translocase subunit SecY n=2 Tax=cellular organisms TaxID=131567 RepID=A8Z685_KARMG|nr:preprotein translocase SecY subunit [Candidatus Karelsulcia muelleri GWSS]EAT14139.1 preprotein translocase SecY subunit [Candidatus Karelsulcia muelleri str. Hc (Homalodisca coagulata)]MBS0018958.1 preprotein translocase subunit SecY [Candidatus Karelsulcia muelleri]MCJ7422523.1 preprotein translocase subunit SecY [Candidatus Karelsulcia muelleri]MCJ7468723.1 preprotein translocase subunit SecY [Candidatus Karelsulcia muelleri]